MKIKVKIVGVPQAKSGFKLNPAHKGWCTPLSNPHCTGKRRQFAINAKNHFKKHDDGGSIPEFDYTNDLQVEDNNFEHLSPQTIRFNGPSHEDGGQMLQYAGNPVEVEGNETGHIDPRDNSMVVGGNLYTQALGGKMKYKKAFEKIATQEKKNSKMQDRASYLLNNFSPDYRTTAPTFNTGKVLADAYEQKKATTEADKNYLTDEQNFQLELAERSGKSPKKINGAIMKAYGGKKIKGYTDDEGEMMTIPNDRSVPMVAVYNPSTRQMDYVPDVPDATQNSYIPTRPPGTGTVADWYNSTPRTVTGTGAKKITGTAKKDVNRHVNQTVDQGVDRQWYYGQRDDIYGFGPHPQEDITPLQISPLTNIPTQTEYVPQEVTIPGLPPVKKYKDLEDDGTGKKRMKGLREKFNPLNYLAEISSFLDSPDQVPSIQTRAIMEPEYNLSLQGKKNAIISAYKPALDSARKNPSQQAAIAGQMAEQLAQVDSEELNMNQQNLGAIRARNLQELRQVRDINTQLTAQQMDKQVQANAITKENKFNAARSVSDKEAQRRARNNNLQLMEDYTGWVYNPNSGKYQMLHPDYQGFDWKTSAPDMNEYNQKKKNKKYTRDAKGHVIEEYDIDTDNKKFGGKVPKKSKKMKYC